MKTVFERFVSKLEEANLVKNVQFERCDGYKLTMVITDEEVTACLTEARREFTQERYVMNHEL